MLISIYTFSLNAVELINSPLWMTSNQRHGLEEVTSYPDIVVGKLRFPRLLVLTEPPVRHPQQRKMHT